MTRKPIRMLAAIAAIVIAGVAVAKVSQDHQRPVSMVVDMTHGDVKIKKSVERRILNAVAATTASASNDELVARGRKVFRDPALFENGESCQTCHAEGAASPATGTMVHDTTATGSPRPPTDFDGPRDPPVLWGIKDTPPFFWGGDVKTLNAALIRPILGHMAKFVPGGLASGNGCEVSGGSTSCTAEVGSLAAALEAYVKTLDPPASAFDEGTMSDAAKRGERIFQGQGGCIECHGGPLFTDNLEHNTGVAQVTFTRYDGTANVPSHDLGAPPPPLAVECAGPAPAAGCNPAIALPAGCPSRQNVAVAGICSAFINTPTLRDLKNSAPYMHNGSEKTLTDVVNFYNNDSALSPLRLTGPQIQDLVAYLESL